MSSVIPALLQELVGRSRARLPEWTVTYGWANTDNPGDFLLIGADNPFETRGEAAQSADEIMTANASGVAEIGEITLIFFSWTQDADQQYATERVFGALGVIVDDLHAGQMLRVEGGDVQGFYVTSRRLSHQLGQDGASALLAVDIHFDAYRRYLP